METDRETRYERIAWTLAAGWTPHDQVAIALDDWGFLQGAVVVDRLRTCQSVPLDIDSHLRRFDAGCRQLGIRLSEEIELGSTIKQCADRNTSALGGQDMSIVLLATPGRSASRVGPPTLIVHSAPIDWQRLNDWHSMGQELRVAEPRNVPKQCWSPELKTRSRLHYFLADQHCCGDRPYAGAVLLDIQGNVTETSAANLLIVENDVLISPMPDTILNGISLQRTKRLAEKASVPFRYEPISPERAKAASEILLCGTSGCLWPAAALDERVFSRAATGPLFCKLRELWKDDIGIDYVDQAARFAAANRS